MGHYCRTPNGEWIDHREHAHSPWGGQQDVLGDGPPQNAVWGPPSSRRNGNPADQPEGIAKVLVADGWTLLTCWDRSGDKRTGSHASFVFHAVLTPDDALREARARFPGVWARIDAHLAKLGLVLRVEAAP